jgi:hypothetical protein
MGKAVKSHAALPLSRKLSESSTNFDYLLMFTASQGMNEETVPKRRKVTT